MLNWCVNLIRTFILRDLKISHETKLSDIFKANRGSTNVLNVTSVKTTANVKNYRTMSQAHHAHHGISNKIKRLISQRVFYINKLAIYHTEFYWKSFLCMKYMFFVDCIVVCIDDLNVVIKLPMYHYKEYSTLTDVNVYSFVRK